MSGAWDDMLRHEQAERERAAGISSVAGLAALRAGARRAGLEYGQAAPEDLRPAHDCADHDTWPCSAVNAARATERENGGDAGAIGAGNSPSPTGQQGTGERGRHGGTEHSTKDRRPGIPAARTGAGRAMPDRDAVTASGA